MSILKQNPKQNLSRTKGFSNEKFKSVYRFTLRIFFSAKALIKSMKSIFRESFALYA